MKKLTFMRAKKEHRKMWKWLAQNPLGDKEDYCFPSDMPTLPASLCFACEYGIENPTKGKPTCAYLLSRSDGKGVRCPIIWPKVSTEVLLPLGIPCRESLYGKWWEAQDKEDREEVSKLADMIAKLPWREEK